MSYDKIIADGLAHKSEDPIVQNALNSARSLDRHSIAAELEHINASELTPLQKADQKKDSLANREKIAREVDSAIVEAFVSVNGKRPPIDDTKHGAELRSYFRTLPEDQRSKALRDPEIAEAVAAAPRALSGLPEQAYVDLKNQVRARKWPEDSARREADLAALQTARVAHDAYVSTAKSTFKAKPITSAHQLPGPANIFVS